MNELRQLQVGERKESSGKCYCSIFKQDIVTAEVRKGTTETGRSMNNKVYFASKSFGTYCRSNEGKGSILLTYYPKHCTDSEQSLSKHQEHFSQN